ncbi:elongator complex protein 1 [Aphelenchoides avenae]|nr:elongator complex protein 1 [Aphelenchus avenae]
MKNLNVYAVATSEGRRYEKWLKEAEKVAVDSLNATTFFALPEHIVGVGKNMEPTTEIDISALRAREHSALVMFDFLTDDRILWMVFESGAMYGVGVQTGRVEQVTRRGSRPIRAAAWSPKLELLIVASDDTLFRVSYDYQLMTVGRDLCEEQFQGAAGRQKCEKTDESPESDDRRVIVSWQADAQLFTVSDVEMLPAEAERSDGSAPVLVDARQLRVWNRKGELVSHCEVLAGMEPVLAMRPSGNVIATTRVLAGLRSVWFFEPNGQYHDDFEIGPAGGLQAESISWNADSSVLTVHLANVVSREHQLQFWTAVNDRWSLKLQLNSTESIVYAAWDPDNAHRFHLLKANGRYERIDLERVHNCADTIAVSACGKKLRVTDRIIEAASRPLSHYELELPSTVVGLCQSPSSLAVLMSDGTLTMYILDSRRYVATKTLDLAGQLGGRVLYGLQFQWKKGNVLSARRTSDNFEIVEIDFEQGKIDVVFTSSTPLAWHAYSSRHGWYICEFEDGKFAQVDGPAKSSPLLLDGQQVDFRAVSCHQCQLIDWRDAIVGLSRDHQLIVNGNVVHSAVGSYRIAGTFLLTVTLTGTLFAIPLANLTTLRSGNFPTDGGVSTLNLDSLCLYSDRTVEPGAALVAHEPRRGTRVWLQMPRGNLEVIQPRALLVQQLRRLSEPGSGGLQDFNPAADKASFSGSFFDVSQSPARRQFPCSSTSRFTSTKCSAPTKNRPGTSASSQPFTFPSRSRSDTRTTPSQKSPARRERSKSSSRHQRSPSRRQFPCSSTTRFTSAKCSAATRTLPGTSARELRVGQHITEDLERELDDFKTKATKKKAGEDVTSWTGMVDAMLLSGRYVFFKKGKDKDGKDEPLSREAAAKKLKEHYLYKKSQ